MIDTRYFDSNHNAHVKETHQHIAEAFLNSRNEVDTKITFGISSSCALLDPAVLLYRNTSIIKTPLVKDTYIGLRFIFTNTDRFANSREDSKEGSFQLQADT
ncbi:hypothetical protein LIER_19895 [Lithospermum erythrorhizon]|uniref:Uncharacterized protein n=1 Tax=Lithospermum erythrorhizon TaxID=34254 RepID=A0AAV3QJK3_LITER